MNQPRLRWRKCHLCPHLRGGRHIDARKVPAEKRPDHAQRRERLSGRHHDHPGRYRACAEPHCACLYAHAAERRRRGPTWITRGRFGQIACIGDPGHRHVFLNASIDIRGRVAWQGSYTCAFSRGVRHDLPCPEHHPEVENPCDDHQQNRGDNRHLDELGPALGTGSPDESHYRSHNVTIVPTSIGIANASRGALPCSSVSDAIGRGPTTDQYAMRPRKLRSAVVR